MSPFPAVDVVLHNDAAETLSKLEDSGDPKKTGIARRARALRPLLLVDCQHGEVVGWAPIPRALTERYAIDNLYVEDLPSFWRLLYTIVRGGGRRYVAVIAIVDHRTYSRWFPGRER